MLESLISCSTSHDLRLLSENINGVIEFPETIDLRIASESISWNFKRDSKESLFIHKLNNDNFKIPKSLTEKFRNNSLDFLRQEKSEIPAYQKTFGNEDEFRNSSKCLVSQYHKGCSCSKFHNNFSINCSNAGLSAVPKKWTEIGDFITTLNLERNQIKEVSDWHYE